MFLPVTVRVVGLQPPENTFENRPLATLLVKKRVAFGASGISIGTILPDSLILTHSSPFLPFSHFSAESNSLKPITSFKVYVINNNDIFEVSLEQTLTIDSIVSNLGKLASIPSSSILTTQWEQSTGMSFGWNFQTGTSWKNEKDKLRQNIHRFVVLKVMNRVEFEHPLLSRHLVVKSNSNNHIWNGKLIPGIQCDIISSPFSACSQTFFSILSKGIISCIFNPTETVPIIFCDASSILGSEGGLVSINKQPFGILLPPMVSLFNKPWSYSMIIPLSAFFDRFPFLTQSLNLKSSLKEKKSEFNSPNLPETKSKLEYKSFTTSKFHSHFQVCSSISKNLSFLKMYSVRVRYQDGWASGYCIHPRGIFLTAAHLFPTKVSSKLKVIIEYSMVRSSPQSIQGHVLWKNTPGSLDTALIISTKPIPVPPVSINPKNFFHLFSQDVYVAGFPVFSRGPSFISKGTLNTVVCNQSPQSVQYASICQHLYSNVSAYSSSSSSSSSKSNLSTKILSLLNSLEKESSIKSGIYPTMLQIDACVHRGNSGSPVFSKASTFVGMISSNTNFLNQTLSQFSYAIPLFRLAPVFILGFLYALLEQVEHQVKDSYFFSNESLFPSSLAPHQKEKLFVKRIRHQIFLLKKYLNALPSPLVNKIWYFKL